MAQFDEGTALVVVDVQNDFADPKGSLYVQGGEKVVPTINGLIEEARRAGAPVVYTQDWHPESTPHFAKDGGIWPVHCVQGTWGAEFHPELTVEGEVVQKGADGKDGYSGFSVRDPTTGTAAPTQLHSLLDPAVQRLVIVGLTGDYCVKETALDGIRLGYSVEVPLALTRFVELTPGDTERSVEEMRAAGVSVT